MSTYNIRLGSQLSFDDEQEKDLIAVIEQLNANHKMGQFVGHLLRIALENPEIMEVKNGKYEKGAIIKQMELAGMSYNRKQFFTDVTKNLADMKKKIDTIYDMTMKMYVLAQMGKHLGLEEKANNSLMATFVLEKQLKDIQDSLGVILSDSVYASNKIDASHSKANDTLEYIIETYDNILNELKATFEVQKVEIPAIQVTQPTQQIVEQTVVQPVQQVIEQPVAQSVVENNSSSDGNDEVLDFGNTADFGALSNFFGE